MITYEYQPCSEYEPGQVERTREGDVPHYWGVYECYPPNWFANPRTHLFDVLTEEDAQEAVRVLTDMRDDIRNLTQSSI